MCVILESNVDFYLNRLINPSAVNAGRVSDLQCCVGLSVNMRAQTTGATITLTDWVTCIEAGTNTYQGHRLYLKWLSRHVSAKYTVSATHNFLPFLLFLTHQLSAAFDPDKQLPYG